MNDVPTFEVPSPPVAPQSVPSVPLPATSRIEYANERPAFRQLVWRGAWLELVTFGFYRFWLATDMRRHLWSHTSVEGDAPEYTGTPKELLIGFLFALAILMPLYLGYFLLGIEAERLQNFLSTPLAAFYYLFVQFAVYRARRYRLTRTVWRGVRFSMGGSGLSYAWRVGLWTMLAFISLGFALPWRQAALERFKMRHTAYGNLQGSFVGTGGELVRRGWGLWALPWGVVIVAGVCADPVPALSIILVLLALVAAPFWYAAYKAIEWRWWIGGLRFGEVRFESEFKSDQLSGLYWMMIVWAVVLGVGLGFWLAIVGLISYAVTGVWASGDPSTAEMWQSPVLLIGWAVGYMAYILGFWAVMRVYLIHDVWQRVASSITVHNLAAARDVVEQGQTMSALGEGLADSLDIGGL
jgi:uncharacterized membrane protein YjgN (DUF898 family)